MPGKKISPLLEQRHRSLLAQIKGSLEALPATATSADVRALLRPAFRHEGGFVESYAQHRPWEGHLIIADIPESLAAAIVARPAYEPQAALTAVSAAPVGGLLVDRDTLSDDEWKDVEGYQALKQFGYGFASALKLAQSPGGVQTYVSFFSAPDEPTWTPVERAMLVALTTSLHQTFERLAMPLMRHEGLLQQVVAEQEMGALVLRRGVAIECNPRAFQLAVSYAPALGISPSAITGGNPSINSLLTRFAVALDRLPPWPGDARRRVRHSKANAFLEVAQHRVRPEVYVVPEEFSLLLLKEVQLPELTLAQATPAVQQLSPALQELALLLAFRGDSIKELAALLGKSEGTLKVHARQLFKKLGVRSRPELTVKLRGGI